MNEDLMHEREFVVFLGNLIDKRGWADGPWMQEPDRIEWRYEGLACLGVRNQVAGVWCGYVGVPDGHPWFKSSPRAPVAVHNGITFADTSTNLVWRTPRKDESSDVYWFGFHCDESCDLAPAFLARLREHSPDWPLGGEVYRDMRFVIGQVERLAAQAIAARS